MKKIVTILLCVLIQAGCGYNSNYDLYIHEQDTIHRINRSGDETIDSVSYKHIYGFIFTDCGNIAYYDIDNKRRLIIKILDTKTNVIEEHLIFENIDELADHNFSLNGMAVSEEAGIIVMSANNWKSNTDSSIIVYDYINELLINTYVYEGLMEQISVGIGKSKQTIYITRRNENYSNDIYEINYKTNEEKLLLESVHNPSISPSGNRIAYTIGELIKFYDIDSSKEIEIAYSKVSTKQNTLMHLFLIMKILFCYLVIFKFHHSHSLDIKQRYIYGIMKKIG